MKLKSWNSYTIFQKVNYLLCSYLLFSIIIILVAYFIDIYNIYISKTTKSEYLETYYYSIAITGGLFVISILPYAFVIFVHEMRKQINPPIPRVYTQIKNGIYILILIGIILPFIVIPFIKDNNSNQYVEIANIFIHKRHPRIDHNYLATAINVLVITFLASPIIGLVNWFHTIGYIVFTKMVKYFKSTTL